MANWKIVSPQNFFDELLFEEGGLREYRESKESRCDLVSEVEIAKELLEIMASKKILVRGKVINQKGHRKLYYMRCTSCGGYMYICLDECLNSEERNDWNKHLRCPFTGCSQKGTIVMMIGKDLDLFED